jgi:hypothetical protein
VFLRQARTTRSACPGSIDSGCRESRRGCSFVPGAGCGSRATPNPATEAKRPRTQLQKPSGPDASAVAERPRPGYGSRAGPTGGGHSGLGTGSQLSVRLTAGPVNGVRRRGARGRLGSRPRGRDHLAERQLPEGSMGRMVQAAMRFVEAAPGPRARGLPRASAVLVSPEAA